MKKSLLFTSLFFLTFTLFAQKDVITKEIKIQDFDKIEVLGAFDVVLKQGKTPLAYLEGKEKHLNEVRFKQDGNKIEFRNSSENENKYSNKEKSKTKKVVLYIQFVDLKKVESAMAGTITCDNKLNFNKIEFELTGAGDTELNLSANEFNLSFDGVGRVAIEGNAKKAVLECNGVGKVDAEDFIVKDLVAECNGIGAMHVHAENSIKMSASGIGSVKNHGNAKEVE